MPKFFKLSYSVLHDDGDHNAELRTQIVEEVVAVVAPSNLPISRNVYTVPLEV